MHKPPCPGYDPDAAGDARAGVFGLPFSVEAANLVAIAVPWEPTTSYRRGTAHGPQAILEASPQLDLFDAELATIGLGQTWAFGIHMLSGDREPAELNDLACAAARAVIEAGGPGDDPELQKAAAEVNGYSEQLHDWLCRRTEALLADGKIVGVVGGDHSAPLGAIRALSDRDPIGILHIDAHADLRPGYEGFRQSHASIMHNVLETCSGVTKIVQVGIRDVSRVEIARIREDSRLSTWFDHRFHAFEGSAAKRAEKVIADLPERVWISFDIDGLDPSLCPHTGTPVPGGLSWRDAMELLMAIPLGGRRVVGFDLCEVAPDPTGHDDWDANVGARLLYRLCGIALHGAGARD